MLSDIYPRFFVKTILVLFLSGACGAPLLAQDAEPSEPETFQILLRGWASLGMVVRDIGEGTNFKARINLNLYGGFYLTNWLAVCAGPGLRVNDGYFHLPFYGGLRLADRRKEISPYLLLAGGAVTNPDIGGREGYLISMAEAGIQFNFEKVHFAIFLAYENLPQYRKQIMRAFNPISQTVEPIGELRRTARYEFLSFGLIFGF